MSGIGQDVTEARKGAVWSEENLLRELINKINQRVETLESRLQPVLRAPTPPSAQEGVEKAVEAVPDLVERLRSRIRTAQEIEGRLVEVIGRLEI